MSNLKTPRLLPLSLGKKGLLAREIQAFLSHYLGERARAENHCLALLSLVLPFKPVIIIRNVPNLINLPLYVFFLLWFPAKILKDIILTYK